MQFFAGWWILIDAMAIDEKHHITTGHVFIGVFGTISLFMVNTVKNSHVRKQYVLLKILVYSVFPLVSLIHLLRLNLILETDRNSFAAGLF